jgi:hypothetical protein
MAGLILNHPFKINWFNASRIYNGEIIIGWLTAVEAGTDSIRVQRLDENGTKMWADELIVANAGITPNYILGVLWLSTLFTTIRDIVFLSEPCILVVPAETGSPVSPVVVC